MLQPLVSIVVPCYNADKFISQTIESVIAQTYRNWELLVIDDCSTDKTSDIVLSYCQKDHRIKLYHTDTQSGGPSFPRNRGIQLSKGNLIAFLDADDIWLPNKLSEQVSFLLINDYDFVFSNYEKISENGSRNNRVVRMKSVVNYSMMLRSSEIPCLTVLLKKSLIKNKYFKAVGKEDYLLWLEILKKGGGHAYNTCKVHALYRERLNSRSSNKFLMLYQQWVILRDFERLNLFDAVYCLVTYMVRGIRKYMA